MLGGKARLRVIAALVGALVWTASPFPEASALTSDEGALLSYTNAARADYGKAGLTLASDLQAIARQHSREMASRRAIFHNSSLTSDVSNWRKIGENVGRGPSARSVHNAFMASTSHRVHILDGAYDYVGIGAVRGSDDLLYVTEIFVDRGAARRTVSKPRVVVTRHPARRPAKPKPKPKPPPLIAQPLTLDFLLRLVAMDAPPAPIPAVLKPQLR